jgi:tight adherence protein C
MMIPIEQIVALAVFLLITMGTWIALSATADRRARAGDRLERLMKGQAHRRPSALVKRQDRIQAIVAKAAPALSKPLKPTNEAELGKLRLKLLNAGFRGEQAVQIFLGIKFACLLGVLLVAGPIIFLKYGFGQTGMIFAILAGGIGFYLPGFVLSQIQQRRSKAIFLGLPDVLDLMVVCVEAGLGLDAAMRRVSNEMAASSPELCEEIAIANFQLQMGRPRKDVLHDLGTRTGVNDMRSLAAVLIQAERFGSSIATALRVQSDSMRIRRRQQAEEKAAKTAVQLIIPLVLFIFPGIFVVLVGPAAIQISEKMMK